MPNYALAKLYLVSNSVNERVYIGATTQTLHQRWKDHRSCARNGAGCPGLGKAIRELGEDNFAIELIQETPCNNASELCVVEFAEMAKYPPCRLYNVHTSREDLVNICRELAARRLGVPRTDQAKLKISDSKRACSKVIEHAVGKVLVCWDERRRLYYIRAHKIHLKSFSVITGGKRARTRDKTLQLAKDWANTHVAALNKKNDALDVEADQHVDNPIA